MFGSINVANNSCCVIAFALFGKLWNNSIVVFSLSSVCHVNCFVLFILIKMKVALSWPLQQNKKTVGCIFLPFNLFTFAPLITRILMCHYCIHVHQLIVCDSLTVYLILIDSTECQWRHEIERIFYSLRFSPYTGRLVMKSPVILARNENRLWNSPMETVQFTCVNLRALHMTVLGLFVWSTILYWVTSDIWWIKTNKGLW